MKDRKNSLRVWLTDESGATNLVSYIIIMSLVILAAVLLFSFVREPVTRFVMDLLSPLLHIG